MRRTSGGGTAILPPTDKLVARSGQGGDFESDPRFQGYIKSDFTKDWSFYSEVPKWAIPNFMSVKFDRYLEGLCYDPHRDLDSLSFTLTLDKNIDLYKNITYTVEELPDKSILYHWQCDIPKEFKDSKSHQIYGKMARTNANPVQMQGDYIFKPLVAPSINFAKYPWVDIRLAVEKQTKDPLRILVTFNDVIRPEWVMALSDPASWTIDTIGHPTSVDIFPQLAAADLHLNEPLKNSTILHLGPVNLDTDLIAKGEYNLDLPGDKSLLLLNPPCWCPFTVQDATHDYIESENFAWAYQAMDTGSTNCQIPGCDSGYHHIHPVSHLPFTFPDSINADQASLSLSFFDGLLPSVPMAYTWLTFWFDGSQGHEISMQWDHCFADYCDDPNKTVTLAANFMNVDLLNPLFATPLQLASGPQVAQWLQPLWADKWDPVTNPNGRCHWATMQGPDYFAQQTCTEYLLVHAQDDCIGHYHALNLCESAAVVLDVKDQYGWHFNQYQAALGGGVWKDLGTRFDQELDTTWPDTLNYPQGLPQDNTWRGEDFWIPIDMTQILEDPTVSDVRARITDNRNNWIRSGNVLPQCNENENGPLSDQGSSPMPPPTPTILDLMFRDNNMYEDLHCYGSHSGGNPDRRVSCDGYVCPRIAGTCDLDVCLVAYACPDEACQTDPLPVTISAPTDEPRTHEAVSANLYLLDPGCHDWDGIYDDYACAATHPVDPNYCAIYCRGNSNNRSYVSGGTKPPLVQATDSEDTTPSDPDHPVGRTEAKLLVTSKDDFAAGYDMRDYAIAIGTGFKTGDDGFIQGLDVPDYFYYGPKPTNGNSGNMRGYCDAVGACQRRGTCDMPNEVTAGFKKSVRNFGFEMVKAECQGHEPAWYPIQSEADIMLVHSHGSIDVRPDDNGFRHHSYMKWFMDYNDENLFLTCCADSWNQSLETIMYPGEFNGYFARDAKWLATTACWLLGDAECTSFSDSLGANLPMPPQDPGGVGYNLYPPWQALCQNAPPASSLCSVLGWRWWDKSAGTPQTSLWTHKAANDAIYLRFVELMNQSPDYVGDSTRWFSGVPASDKAVRCYMEAGWEFYNEKLPEDDTWTSDPPSIMPGYNYWGFAVLAVDSQHRYILDLVDQSSGSYFFGPRDIGTL